MTPCRLPLERYAVSLFAEHTMLSPALWGPPPFLSLAVNHHNSYDPCLLRVLGFGCSCW